MNVETFDHITSAIGKPFYRTTNCAIYNMSCIEGMSVLKGANVDLTITSPPYNIGKEYESDMSLADYIEWSRNWMNLVHSCTGENGAFWLNVGYTPLAENAKALPLTYLLWNLTPFYLIQEVVWQYGAGVSGRRFFSPRNEKLLWFVKNKDSYTFNLDQVRDPNVKYPNQKKNGKLKCNPLGKNPGDVWSIPKVTSGKNRSSKERTKHPAQYPEALIDRVLQASSNAGNLVLDPFLGSGTTAVISLRHDRRFIGFEIDKSYCRIAADRIESEFGIMSATQLRLV